MTDNKKPKAKKVKIKISGLDIDKAEYGQIVLSNSNNPDKKYLNISDYEK